MPNVIYDVSNPLPSSGANARLELVGDGSTLIDLAVTSETVIAIRALGTQRILIGKNGSAIGQLYGLDLLGSASTVYNEGAVESKTSTAIIFSGGGANSLINHGTIKAKGLALEGNGGSDRITNYGILQTTSDAADAVLLDLKGGDDFYNGMLGTATGGIIKLGLGNDTAYGGAGSDIFWGDEGADSIDGGAGNDSLYGGEGNDTLDGGAGNDTVDYSHAAGGVTVDLNKTSAQTVSDGEGSDTLIDIENVTGSAHADTLIGDTGNNTLRGGDGDDTLDGGLGSDRLEGGAGTNTARYKGTSAATVDLTKQGQIQPTGGYGYDFLSGITNLEGGSGADKFTGDVNNNQLVGNGGNDTLIGGKGNDTLDGGPGQDTAEFSGARADYMITYNPNGEVTVTDALGSQRDGTDTLKDVRFVKFADQTIALTNEKPSSISLSSTNVAENTAVGTSVADLSGSDPDGDKLTYRITSDPDGLFGLDSSGKKIILMRALDYEKASQHTISITADDGYGGEFTKTFTITVRNVTETTPLVRYGTARADQVTGESGNDKLFGMGGNDTLTGQIGNDTLTGGTGNDTLFGGQGKDVFVFDQKPNAKSNLDYLPDFNPNDDIIHLSRKFFSKLSKGTLSSKAFLIGDHFKDKDDRILYLKKSGGLFYDPDGSGSAKAIQFASIAKNLKLTHKDFFII